MSSFRKIQAKLIETGTVFSTKTIQRMLSLEFGFKSCKQARKTRWTKVVKNRLDFSKRHATWDVQRRKKIIFSDKVSPNQ